MVVQLKYFGMFWTFLNLPLVNCKIELDLTWLKYCVISGILTTPEVAGDNPADETLKTGATFQINNSKIFVPVVTLSI